MPFRYHGFDLRRSRHRRLIRRANDTSIGLSITSSPGPARRADGELGPCLPKYQPAAAYTTNHHPMVSSMNNEYEDLVNSVLVPLFAAMTIDGKNLSLQHAAGASASSHTDTASKDFAVTSVILKPKPLESFELFPNLPIELRLRIWDLSLPAPRIVELDRCGANGELFSPILGTNGTNGLIRANFESRETFLNQYIPVCRQAHPGTGRSLFDYGTVVTMRRSASTVNHNFDSAPRKRVYINFDKDTIFFGAPCDGSRRSTLEVFSSIVDRAASHSLGTGSLVGPLKRMSTLAVNHSELRLVFWKRFLENNAPDVLTKFFPKLTRLIVIYEYEVDHPHIGYVRGGPSYGERLSGAVTLTKDCKNVRRVRNEVAKDPYIQALGLEVEVRAIQRAEHI